MVMQRSLAEIGYQAFDKQLLRTYGLFFNFAPMEKILVVPAVYFEPEAMLKGAESEIKPYCKCTLVES
mgnify:FL=1